MRVFKKLLNLSVASDLTVFEEVGMFSVVIVESVKVKKELKEVSSLTTCLGVMVRVLLQDSEIYEIHEIFYA